MRQAKTHSWPTAVIRESTKLHVAESEINYCKILFLFEEKRNGYKMKIKYVLSVLASVSNHMVGSLSHTFLCHLSTPTCNLLLLLWNFIFALRWDNHVDVIGECRKNLCYNVVGLYSVVTR